VPHHHQSSGGGSRAERRRQERQRKREATRGISVEPAHLERHLAQHLAAHRAACPMDDLLVMIVCRCGESWAVLCSACLEPVTGLHRNHKPCACYRRARSEDWIVVSTRRAA
jgi:hypothetical protein